MPFKSKAQQRWMFANEPEMAKRWAKHTKNIKNLPEKKSEKSAVAAVPAPRKRSIQELIQVAQQPEKPAAPAPVKTAAEGLIGGLADGKPDSKYNVAQLAEGAKVEKEHTDNPEEAKEVAKDHLEEIPDYYSRLSEMEEEAKEDEEDESEKQAAMQKQALVSAFLNVLGKYGLQKALPWITKRLGAAHRGAVNTALRSAGRSVRDAGKWVAKRPVLEDAMSGAAFLPLTTGEDESYAEAALRDIPLAIGAGQLFRGGEKLVSNFFKKKSAAVPAERMKLLKSVADWINERTALEHAVIGGTAGAALTPVSDKPLKSNIMQGGTVGAGIGMGALAGSALADKLLAKKPGPIVSKLLTRPSAATVGAAAGGLVANQIFNILHRFTKGAEKSGSDKVGEMYTLLASYNNKFNKE